MATTAAGRFAIDRYSMDGDGGTSSDGRFAVTGALSEPDTSAQPARGARLAVTGGFLAGISLVQPPGLPELGIRKTASGIQVFWTGPADADPAVELEESSDLKS